MPSLSCEWLSWWVSPYINHFISADTIVPNPSNPQSLNRYSYVNNNPVRYTDPTGHMVACNPMEDDCHDPDPAPSPASGSGGNGGGGPHDDDDVPDPNPNGLPAPGSMVPSAPIPSGSCSGAGCPIVSAFPLGAVCTAVPYCFVYPESPEPYPWLPDYWVLDFSIPVFVALGANIQPFILDKYGGYYVAGGGGLGTSPIPGLKANFSLSGGYIFDENTTAAEAKSFLEAGTISGCGGFYGGACGTWGDPSLSKGFEWNDIAVQLGLFSPQIGVSGTYGLLTNP